MIIRGTPKELNKYIIVDGDMVTKLHENGYFPKYIDENGVYFDRNEEVLKFIEKGGK